MKRNDNDILIDIPIGDCPICYRPAVRLRAYIDARGTDRIACLDERACLAAYTRRRTSR